MTSEELLKLGKGTNIGFARALTEIFSDENDLYEIAQYLIVYCQARSNEKLAYPFEYEASKGGVE